MEMKIYPYQDGDRLIELVEKREYDTITLLAHDLANLRAEDMATINDLRNQLDRICKDGFGNDDTIGLEPADDYVLRRLKNERDEARQKLAVLQDLLNDLEDPLQLIAEYWDRDETLESMTGACWHAVGTAEKALEKIRPHLKYYGS